MSQTSNLGCKSSSRTAVRAAIGVLFILAMTVVQPAAATPSASVPMYPYTTPVFGLATAPDGSIFVADAGRGIVQLDFRRGNGTLFADLPGVTDIAPIGRGYMFAVTGLSESPMAQKLFRVARGQVQEIADLGAFEEDVNPDGGMIDSNPFDVEALSGGKVLVADAGGNDLLIVDQKGKVDWVATLPDEPVPTNNAKNLIGCPDPPEELPEFIKQVCFLPDMIPAQAVATSVAVGPDGAYYVSELKGFPGPIGGSKIWRIEPGTRHARCGLSPACTVVAEGFTSIVDITFGPDGTLYVVEIEEASFLALELAFFFGVEGIIRGGTVNACDIGSGSCTAIATGLLIPIAATVGTDGRVYAAIKALIPGEAEVVAL